MPAPSTPTNYYLQQGNGQVFLSFDLMSGATTYPILRSTDGVTFAQIAAPATNYYLDTSVTIGTLYYYQVESKNGSGTSTATTAQSIVPVQSGAMCLGQLRLMSQQRADRVGSTFLTVPEWNTNINQSAFELYDLLTTQYEDYFLAPALTINTTSIDSTGGLSLPDGTLYSGAPAFYKLSGVDLGLSGSANSFVTLRKFDFIARNQYVYPQITTTFLGVFNLRYRLMGSKIMFTPIPQGGQYIRLWYQPRMTMLLQDNDIFDSVSGWEEYIIVDAAIKALQKEEADVSVLAMQKQALIQRIEDSSMNRDVGQGDCVSDIRNRSEMWGGDGGNYPSGGF